MTKSIALYIHIPFCKSKCFYCDFNSFKGIESYIEKYLCALYKELDMRSKKLSKYTIKSIFIGGGTPSYLNLGMIHSLLNNIKTNYNINNDAEISIETNPGTLTMEKCSEYKDSGINRISIGLQAWQNKILKKLGRTHSLEDFLNSIQIINNYFSNINIDLMFGIPGLTIKDWKDTLLNVVKLNPSHLSCYSLKIEENTVFGDMYKEQEVIDEELDRDMYHFCIEFLKSNGYNHYEISNFSKPGFECRHNITYWKCEEYLGFGLGAHSYLNKKRFNNITNIEEYIKLILSHKTAVESYTKIDENESISEFVILGLRMISGIDIKEFNRKFNKDFFKLFDKKIDKLINNKLIYLEQNSLKLTKLGLNLCNKVFVEFI